MQSTLNTAAMSAPRPKIGRPPMSAVLPAISAAQNDNAVNVSSPQTASDNAFLLPIAGVAILTVGLVIWLSAPRGEPGIPPLVQNVAEPALMPKEGITGVLAPVGTGETLAPKGAPGLRIDSEDRARILSILNKD